MTYKGKVLALDPVAYWRLGEPTGDYADAVLALDPVAYWRLGEASGTTATDASGNTHDGTYVNTPTLGVVSPLVGDADTAVGFAQSPDSYVALPGNLHATEFTWAGWVRADDHDGTTRFVYVGGRSGTAPTGSGWSLAFTSGNNLEFASIGTTNSFGPAIPFTSGVWRFVVCRMDAAKTKTIWIDGVLAATLAHPGYVASTTQTSSISHSTVGGTFSADEVAFFDRALTADEIAMLHAKALDPSAPGGDPDVTTAVDASGNGHDGTYVGGPTLGVAGLLTGDPDTAVELDEVDDWMRTPDTDFRFAGDFSVVAWLTPDATGVSNNGVVSRFFNTNGNRAWRVGLTSALKPVIELSVDGTAQVARSTTSAAVSGESLVAWVYRAAAGEADLYIDDVLVQTVTGLPTSIYAGELASPSLRDLGIGSWDVSATGANLFKGVLDELAIFDRALTAAEIAELYVEAINPGPPVMALTIAGVDRTAYVKPITALEIVGQANEGSGTATIPLRVAGDSWEPAADDAVRITQDGDEAFEGFVRRIAEHDPGWSSGPRIYTLACRDFNTLLTEDVIETAYRSVDESDKERITWLVQTFGTKGVTAGAEVQELLAQMPPGTDDRPEQDFSGKTLERALRQIEAITGGRHYVDFDKRLHYFDEESNAAPFALSDDPNGSTTYGHGGLVVTTDSIEVYHRVLVIGAEGLKVWREVDPLPVDPVQIRSTVISESDIVTEAEAIEVGDAFLAEHGEPRRTARMHTYKAGLRAGQYVAVTDAGHEWDAEVWRIASIRGVPVGGGPRLRFDLELGGSPHDMATFLGGQRGVRTIASQALVRAERALRRLADLSVAGANMGINSSFENADTTGFGVGTGWVFGFEVADAYDGEKVARADRTAAALGDLTTPAIAVDRLDDWWISALSWMRAYTSGTALFELREYDDTDTLLATTVIASITAAEARWTRHAIHMGPNDQLGRHAFHADTVAVRLAWRSDGAATFTWDVDAYQVERGKLLTAYAPYPSELLDSSVDLGVKGVFRSIVAGLVALDTLTGELIATDTLESRHHKTGSLLVGHRAAKGGNLLDNSSFETAPVVGFDTPITDAEDVEPYWDSGTVGCVGYYASASARTGTKVLRIAGDGATNMPGLTGHLIPVAPGKTYRVAAYMQAASGGEEGIVRVDSYDAAEVLVAAGVASLSRDDSSLALKETTYTVPTDGTVSFLRVLCYINVSPAAVGDIFLFEDVALEEVPGDVLNSTGTFEVTPTGARFEAGQFGDSTEMVVDQHGFKVEDASGERVRVGRLSSSPDTWGLRVTGDTGTVIIDGSSRMFRVAASGTVSRAQGVDSGGSSDTVLSGLGAWPDVPAVIPLVSFSNATDNNIRQLGIEVQGIRVTNLYDGMHVRAHLGSYRTPTNNFAGIRLSVTNRTAASVTAYVRYHLLFLEAL